MAGVRHAGVTRTDRSSWVALGALCACFFMIMLDSTVVTVTIPAMLTGLRANLNEIIWVNSVYLLANTVPLLITGRLGDRFGPKRMLLIGLVIFTGASLWCGLAGSPGALIAARAVQGLGAAAMTPQTLAFISRLFPPEGRRVPIAIWGAVAGVAIITGPVLGGILVQHLSWRWIFLMNLPIGVAGMAIAIVFLPDWRPGRRLRFDAVGAGLASLGLFAVVFGVQNGQHYHWGTVFGPVGVLPLIAAGVVLLGVFAWRQGRAGTEPLIPPILFAHSRNPGFSNANLTHAALGFASTGMFLPLVIYLQTVLGLSALRASLLTLPMAVAAGIAAAIAGRARVRATRFVRFGLGALAAGTTILAWQAEPSTAPLALIPGLIVAGVGIGCVYAPLTSAAMANVPTEQVGSASGVFNLSRQVGGVLGSAASGLLLQIGIAVSVPVAARDYAERLPFQYRDQFVDAISRAANTASQFSGTGPQVPADVSPSVAEHVRRVATEAFQLGFTNAAKATLVLPIVVLVLGMISAAGLPDKTREWQRAF
jgi:EmrB/QacA subfamily drug resistance transporter